MTQPVPLPFGLRDVKIIPYPTMAATAFGSTLIDWPAASTLSFTASEESTDLEGDDTIVASQGSGLTGSGTLEGGGVSFEAYAAVNGGTVFETGVSPNRVKTYRRMQNDVRPYWAAVGQSINSNGGDFHRILYRCRANGDIGGDQGYGEFYVSNFDFAIFPCLVDGNIGGEPILGAMYDFVQNETIAAITAPALD